MLSPALHVLFTTSRRLPPQDKLHVLKTSCMCSRHAPRFISRIDIVFGTEGLTMVGVAMQELTVTCNVSGDNW